MIKLYKTIVLVLLLLVSNKTFSQLSVFEDGEELYYEVYYSFINIGWVKINTTKVLGKKDTYLSHAVLKSNDALPFVNVNYEFTSKMEVWDNQLRPLYFESKEFEDSKASVLTYNFNFDSGFVDMKKTGYNNESLFNKRYYMKTYFQDGLSIFYYARFNYFNRQTINVPVLFNQDSVNVTLNFNTDKTKSSISSVDYDISSLDLDGNTDYELVYGLTGHFEGWFSNDNSRIPLKAKFTVKIGNITLELKSWRRNNWTPPKY